MDDVAEPTAERKDDGDRAVDAMLADPRRALHVSGVLLATTVAVFLFMWSTSCRSLVQHVDNWVLDFSVSTRLTPLVWLAKALSVIGGTWCTWIIRAAVAAVLVRRKRWMHLGAFVTAVVTSELLIGVFKRLYDRPRPPHSLVATSSASFPSGHAVAAAVTAVGLVIVLLPAGHERWVWERRAAVYASLIAASRTYLAAHWLSDVVAGSLLGSTIAIGSPALFIYVALRTSRRRSPP